MPTPMPRGPLAGRLPERVAVGAASERSLGRGVLEHRAERLLEVVLLGSEDLFGPVRRLGLISTSSRLTMRVERMPTRMTSPVGRQHTLRRGARGSWLRGFRAVDRAGLDCVAHLVAQAWGGCPPGVNAGVRQTGRNHRGEGRVGRIRRSQPLKPRAAGGSRPSTHPGDARCG